jgi:dihydrofolate reductase
MTDNQRAVVASVLVSLNGVVSEPHKWVGDHFSERSAERALDQLDRSDAMLMGRRTYEIFASLWPGMPGPYAERLNTMPKYVYSSTLHDPAWTGTTVVAGDVADHVRALKRAGGRDLVLYGLGRFGQTLCDAGLIDELTLTLIPVFVSEGGTLFRPGAAPAEWQLAGTADAGGGSLAVTYRPLRR